MSASKKTLYEQLRLRVNPEFDHDIEPEDNQFAYWNPVSATNDLIKLANSTLEITQAITDAMRERTKLTIALREVSRELEDVENTVMVQEPLSPTEAKTLKTISAALERRFETQGYVDHVRKLKDKRDKLNDEIEKLDDRIEAGHAWNKTSERVSDNLKTALSFFKDERRRAYQF
jgi:uncharacterized coiled-coil DUF342 family protein